MFQVRWWKRGTLIGIKGWFQFDWTPVKTSVRERLYWWAEAAAGETRSHQRPIFIMFHVQWVKVTQRPSGADLKPAAPPMIHPQNGSTVCPMAVNMSVTGGEAASVQQAAPEDRRRALNQETGRKWVFLLMFISINKWRKLYRSLGSEQQKDRQHAQEPCTKAVMYEHLKVLQCKLSSQPSYWSAWIHSAGGSINYVINNTEEATGSSVHTDQVRSITAEGSVLISLKTGDVFNWLSLTDQSYWSLYKLLFSCEKRLKNKEKVTTLILM